MTRRPPTAEEREAGQALKRAMSSANYDQQELAAQLGLTPSNISQWVTAHTRLPWDRAEQVAKILKCSPADISVPYRKLPASRHPPQVKEDVIPYIISDGAPVDKTNALEVVARSLVAILARHAPIEAAAFAEHLEVSARKKGISLEFDLIAEVLNIARSTPAAKAAFRKRA